MGSAHKLMKIKKRGFGFTWYSHPCIGIPRYNLQEIQHYFRVFNSCDRVLSFANCTDSKSNVDFLKDVYAPNRKTWFITETFVRSW